jgi:signal transduction histidine kinase
MPPTRNDEPEPEPNTTPHDDRVAALVAPRGRMRGTRALETVLLASTACLLAAVAWPIATEGLRTPAEPSTELQAEPPVEPAPVTEQGPRIQIALLLDTSGSMDGLIDQARSQLWSVVNALDSATFRGEQPRLEIALYEYGNDRLAAKDGWIRQVQGFTSELDVISEALFSLSTFGGSEHAGQVVARSTDELAWHDGENVLRVLSPFGLETPLPRGVKARFSMDATSIEVVRGDELEPSLRNALHTKIAGDQSHGSSSRTDLDELHLVPELDTVSKMPVSQRSQSSRSVNELTKRAGNVADNLEVYRSTLDLSLRNQANEGRVDGNSEAGPIQALWIGDALVLVRSLRSDLGIRHVGSVLDWDIVRSMLHAEIDDLLPEARVEPISSDGDPDGRRLATLPVRLEPGLLSLAPPPGWSPLRATVITGWAFLLLAGLAVALLLRGSLALSERRAAFVSAVTHELRTPLTTFRMYTEMLQEGMVESKRERYLATLRREADRLGNLVENVLTYARIESDRPPRALEVTPIVTLVERMRERLDQRCAASRLELLVEQSAAAADGSVCVDSAVVEQIVFNLVDNAAKYAPSEEHARVHLEVRRVKNTIEIHVRDFGPGIMPTERKRIFEPFAKGSKHAAGTQPGVGLGLALSRRLARELGGDLEVHDADPGADFVLSLPVSTSNRST